MLRATLPRRRRPARKSAPSWRTVAWWRRGRALRGGALGRCATAAGSSGLGRPMLASLRTPSVVTAS
eukprot:4003931-Pyramimonas_sp.AAC.1